MQSNVRDHVLFPNPKTAAQREQVAGSCVRNLHIAIPALIDSIDNKIEQAYTAWPDRLYVIGKDGRVDYKSAPGPFGFDPKKLARAVGQI
jgi:hypothetical protein